MHYIYYLVYSGSDKSPGSILQGEGEMPPDQIRQWRWRHYTDWYIWRYVDFFLECAWILCYNYDMSTAIGKMFTSLGHVECSECFDFVKYILHIHARSHVCHVCLLVYNNGRWNSFSFWVDMLYDTSLFFVISVSLYFLFSISCWFYTSGTTERNC